MKSLLVIGLVFGLTNSWAQTGINVGCIGEDAGPWCANAPQEDPRVGEPEPAAPQVNKVAYTCKGTTDSAYDVYTVEYAFAYTNEVQKDNEGKDFEYQNVQTAFAKIVSVTDDSGLPYKGDDAAKMGVGQELSVDRATEAGSWDLRNMEEEPVFNNGGAFFNANFQNEDGEINNQMFLDVEFSNQYHSFWFTKPEAKVSVSFNFGKCELKQ